MGGVKKHRLIDADALMQRIEDSARHAGFHQEDYCKIRRFVAKTPTIEAEPVRHAYWKELLGCGYTVCSACDFIPYSIKDKFCPKCGEKMDGGAEE